MKTNFFSRRSWLTASSIAGIATLNSTQLFGATADVEGQRLVRELRDLRPAQTFNNTGVMEIRRQARQRVSVYLKTLVDGEQWHSVYGTAVGQTLVISQSHDGPNVYRSLPPAGVNEQLNIGAQRVLRNSLIPFAGSDFWMFDLGLEFLQWPVQRVIGSATRKTMKCHVLESVNPFPRRGAYSRVVSYISVKSKAIVTAEAFDHQGKLWKRFEPKELRKVDGKYRLKKIEMRDFRTDSKTTLTFDRELR